MLEHHVGSSADAPGSPPRSTPSHTMDGGPGYAAGPVHPLDAVDYSICFASLNGHRRGECAMARPLSRNNRG